MNLEPFITCAVTGASDTAGKHPELPVTPQQIADSALEAAEAGAAIVHVHVRDPETTEPSRDTALYREAVEKIRAGNPELLINLTTGLGGDLVVGDEGAVDSPAAGSDFVGAMERIAHVEELRPEICTLDCGSMNFDDDRLVYIAPPAYLRATAARLRELGVKPEMELFDLGHLELVKVLIAEELIESPPFIQFCHGIPYGAPATTAALVAMTAHVPNNAVWSAFAVGRMQMPFVAQTVQLGGNVRVGLEDNLYLDRGVLASNADLVRRAREILERLGTRVAGPAQVRERLGLGPGG